MRRRVIAGLAAAGVMAALLVAVYQAYARFEADRGRYPIQGIDISEAQGEIDWDTLAGHLQAGFVYMRATEGTTQNDARFEVNWAAAGRLGIWRGAYHVFDPCRAGAEQARAFLAAVPVEPEALPPAVVLEPGSGCSDWPTRDALLAELAAFLAPVDRQYGKPTVLLATGDVYRTYLAGALDDRAYWLHSLIARPRYGPEAWYFWQYNDQGWREGIGGPVNLDVFYGNAEEFEAFRRTGGAAG